MQKARKKNSKGTIQVARKAKRKVMIRSNHAKSSNLIVKSNQGVTNEAKDIGQVGFVGRTCRVLRAQIQGRLKKPINESAN